MFIAYVTVTIFTAVANIFSAMADFVRYRQVFSNMARAGVPESWMTTLGLLKTAGALGLLIGLGVPLIGTAAAVGLVLFFVGALSPIYAHTSTDSGSYRQLCSSSWP